MARRLVVLLVFALVLVACNRDEEAEPESEPVAEVVVEEPEPEPEPEDTRPRSPFTGEPIDEELLERPLLAVKIENSPQARPQSGLDAADVVFEELVEGGITRFVALFHTELPEVAGPIRSARPVTTELLHGLEGAGFAFSGARAEVQAMLRQTPTINITEGGAGFYRDSSRRAPHNLYIRTEDTLEGVIERGAEPLDDLGWVFDEDVPPGEQVCPETATEDDCDDPGLGIDVRMSTASTSNWEYVRRDGVYRRSQNGQPFLVTGEGEIGAANVVVLATRHYVGASGFPETSVVSEERRAIVLRDGRRYEARWSKPTASSPLLLSTIDGERFPLKPGRTWVHLPSEGNLPEALGTAD